MVFTSLIYPVFLIVTALLYYVIPGRFRWVLLLIASIAYYLSFIPFYLLIITLAVIINYYMALLMAVSAGSARNHIFIITILINLLVLCVFKYSGIIFPGLHLTLHPVDLFFRTDPVNTLIMPFGLSYLIFTVLSYQIELKRGNILPEKHPGYFSLYLLFFPRIGQGPIERPASLLRQLHQVHNFDPALAEEGLRTILLGYFKKIVVADRLAIYVDAVYGNSSHHNGTSLMLATIFFAFQIYADFSGYTDIAIGSAKLFGIRLSENFRQPYMATSIKDFWDRWHISFSHWLRDYIFAPLAFRLTSFLSKIRFSESTAEKLIYSVSIITTFVICGIWHGVGWNYVAWGLMFGVLLTFSLLARNFNKALRKRLHIGKNSSFRKALGISQTFLILLFVWIIFRAGSLSSAFDIAGKILTDHGQLFYERSSDLIFSILGICSIIVIDVKNEFFSKKAFLPFSRFMPVRIAAVAFVVIVILLSGVFDGSQFIYFQF
ncbi:MAG TPA: MBOAT family O-acyltransferase [Bacteroidales bacterium]|nr:MBOAT family O-acyltransferase [Bacteroidales bacterium]